MGKGLRAPDLRVGGSTVWWVSHPPENQEAEPGPRPPALPSLVVRLWGITPPLSIPSLSPKMRSGKWLMSVEHTPDGSTCISTFHSDRRSPMKRFMTIPTDRRGNRGMVPGRITAKRAGQALPLRAGTLPPTLIPPSPLQADLMNSETRAHSGHSSAGSKSLYRTQFSGFHPEKTWTIVTVARHRPRRVMPWQRGRFWSQTDTGADPALWLCCAWAPALTLSEAQSPHL